jgi:hypothetical protein
VLPPDAFAAERAEPMRTTVTTAERAMYACCALAWIFIVLAGALIRSPLFGYVLLASLISGLCGLAVLLYLLVVSDA